MLCTLLVALGAARGADLAVHRVSAPGLAHALHFYFQQSPESPDGRLVVYNALHVEQGATDVFICAPDGSGQRKIATVNGKPNMHTGVASLWLDSRTVAFVAGGDRVHLIDVISGSERVVSGAIGDLCATTGLVAFRINRGESSTLEPGIYVLDVKQGQSRRLFGAEDVQRFAAAMNVTRPAVEWRFDHPLWSPDGRQLIFELKTGAKSRSTEDFLLVANASGTDLRLFGLKPMHPGWWNNELVFGHDWAHEDDKVFKLWTLDGKISETAAGVGCHGAVSPDREWIATESWYRADPIVLRLFRRGETQPTAVLFTQEQHSKEIWEMRTHVHPAFSRDGKRVYFNAWPAGAPGPQVMSVDISSIVAGSAGAR